MIFTGKVEIGVEFLQLSCDVVRYDVILEFVVVEL